MHASPQRPSFGRPSFRRPPSGRSILVALIAVTLVSFVVLRILMPWITASGAGPFAAVPTVTKVIDGDTIDVRIGRQIRRIRLIGIDTPETKDPRKSVQCFGKEASARTEALLPPGTEVRLERDVEETDVYDRTLAYVYRSSDGLFVNLSLVAEGLADTLRIAPNTAHAAVFAEAAARARNQQLGLWKACDRPARTGR
jgi:micrococcal nuclease